MAIIINFFCLFRSPSSLQPFSVDKLCVIQELCIEQWLAIFHHFFFFVCAKDSIRSVMHKMCAWYQTNERTYDLSQSILICDFPSEYSRDIYCVTAAKWSLRLTKWHQLFNDTHWNEPVEMRRCGLDIHLMTKWTHINDWIRWMFEMICYEF